jgi:uncharacterized membrane protein YfcA
VNTFRGLLAIVAGAAFGILAGELILGLGPRQAGICIVVIAACVIAWFGVRAVQRDKQREADKARHPAIWAPPGGVRRGTIIFDHQPRDRSGMECGRCGKPTFFSHKCIDDEMVRGAIDGLVG